MHQTVLAVYFSTYVLSLYGNISDNCCTNTERDKTYGTRKRTLTDMQREVVVGGGVGRWERE